MSDDKRPLIIACGALVSELREVLNINGLNEAVEVRYLPANLHNRPEGIVPALREHLDGRGSRPTMVGYADCGTGGALDRMLESYPDVQRIPGAHCYEFFAGSELFAQWVLVVVKFQNEWAYKGNGGNPFLLGESRFFWFVD